MKKILINTSYGGFGFSKELLNRFGITDSQYSQEVLAFQADMKNRTNPYVIKVVEELGTKRASGSSCRLCIKEVKDNDIYRIEEHDGCEKLVYVGTLVADNILE
jgi:hypothetical protein